MSDVKTTLAFEEFSDLCQGFIGYSHHMVALFDECDDVKHLRHPISFIEAVNRLKKTIKPLFERLETDKVKYVVEYEIGTYCWNSKVGKTIDPMKPPTLPVVIKNQCDGMIMIACITDELIPKAIKEKKREDSRMDPLVYAHGLTHAIIQHFTFNSPDCRLRNKSYEHNMKQLSSAEAVGIYVTYNFRQESTDKLLNVEEEQGSTMSDVKPTLAFAEFSDLCRGSIGYSHHMVALFDECDDVKHLRHPLSFIEAVNRLKKTIKRLFERLETDQKKYVAEYEIGTYCWNSKVGKTIDPMKPPTLPVVIKNQCEGMIMIGCITDELIPKAIKEKKREDSRMDPLVYAHGLTHAIIQHFTFNSPDCRLRNKLYEHNMKKLSIVEAVAIYVTYNFRQESTDKLLNVEEEQVSGQNLFKMQLEEIGYQYCGSMQQDDGNSFFLACIDQLKGLGIEAVNCLELKQMVISQLKFLPEVDYRDEFSRTDWLSYIDRLSKNSKECIKDVVVRTTGCCLNQHIIIYHSGTPNEPVKKYFPRIGSIRALVLAEENNYYIGLQKLPQWQGRTGIKRPADSSPSTSTPTKKVHFKAESQEFANSETPMTNFTSENGKSTSTITTLQFSGDSQVPSVSSTLQETTEHIGSQPQREPPIATDTTPTKQVTQQKGPKSERKPMKKMTKDEKILILNCYNQLNVKNNYDVFAEKVYAKREECLSRDLVQHYEKNLDVSTTLKSRIKSYIQRVQRGKDNETDLEVKDLISRSGLIISRNDNASAESNEPRPGYQYNTSTSFAK